jgi:hypothetical protein
VLRFVINNSVLGFTDLKTQAREVANRRSVANTQAISPADPRSDVDLLWDSKVGDLGINSHFTIRDVSS